MQVPHIPVYLGPARTGIIWVTLKILGGTARAASKYIWESPGLLVGAFDAQNRTGYMTVPSSLCQFSGPPVWIIACI